MLPAEDILSGEASRGNIERPRGSPKVTSGRFSPPTSSEAAEPNPLNPVSIDPNAPNSDFAVSLFAAVERSGDACGIKSLEISFKDDMNDVRVDDFCPLVVPFSNTPPRK